MGVYSREILRGLPELHPEADYLFCYRAHRYLRAPRQHRALLTSFWPRRLDLFHSLNQRVDGRHYRHAVATFHDLFVLTAEYSTEDFRQRFAAQARQAAQRSDLVIAVSQFTASQVERLLGFPRERIRVIPHGVRRPASVQPGSAREKLILFVGAIQVRKNVARLVRAFEAVPSGWKLVLAGSYGYGAEQAIDAVSRSRRRNDIVLTGYVTADELESLYQRAAVFAFPSLDEGFGMPVLEAMAHGIPVLTSNGSALREIAGDAALLVDPQHEESIAEGLRCLVQDEELRRQFTAKGLHRCSGFSWSATVDQTWRTYRELLP
ncbi:MAG: glycosyltransferase family 4 protein [Acidobacteriaceae bacterium]|nr:glycosyltransferase family 4 protein [Acidobacteriaceae bacterium]